MPSSVAPSLTKVCNFNTIQLTTVALLGQTDKELYRKITNGEFHQPEWLSDDSFEFLHWMMNVNADERPSATEVREG